MHCNFSDYQNAMNLIFYRFARKQFYSRNRFWCWCKIKVGGYQIMLLTTTTLPYWHNILNSFKTLNSKVEQKFAYTRADVYIDIDKCAELLKKKKKNTWKQTRENKKKKEKREILIYIYRCHVQNYRHKVGVLIFPGQLKIEPTPIFLSRPPLPDQHMS